jgi:glycosyltransferase involved in cell wall biosynthesis
MNVLFYHDPKSAQRGPDSVVWHLSKALSKKVDLTYFPQMKSKKWVPGLINVFGKFLTDDYDIIHYVVTPNFINGSYLILNSANRHRMPTILNIHGLLEVENAFEPHRDIANFIWKTSFNSCKLANRVIANSDYMKERISHYYSIAPEKIVVIPNGVDLKKYSSCKSSITLSGDPAILSVGRVCMLKGFNTMVNAIGLLSRDLPNVKLHFVGRVSNECKNFVKRRGLEKYFIFHGEVPNSLIPVYLKSANFGVFGSIIYEGFGLALIEAMTSGLPIIASDIGTYREIITNGKDGLLYKKADARSLSDAISLMNSEIDLRKKISKNGKVTTEKYDWGKISDQYISLYNELRS